jgi:hypothetical protein
LSGSLATEGAVSFPALEAEMPTSDRTVPQSTMTKFLLASLFVAIAFAFETGAFSGL